MGKKSRYPHASVPYHETARLSAGNKSARWSVSASVLRAGGYVTPPLEGAAVLCELNLWAVIVQEGNECHPVQPPGTQPRCLPRATLPDFVTGQLRPFFRFDFLTFSTHRATPDSLISLSKWVHLT